MFGLRHALSFCLAAAVASKAAGASPVLSLVVSFGTAAVQSKQSPGIEHMARTLGLVVAEQNLKYRFTRLAVSKNSKLKISELKNFCEKIKSIQAVSGCQLEITSVPSQDLEHSQSSRSIEATESPSPPENNSQKLFGCLDLKPHPSDPSRSLYWAQMYTGADLARDEVASFAKGQNSLAYRVRVEAVDTSAKTSAVSGPDSIQGGSHLTTHADEVMALVADPTVGGFGGHRDRLFKSSETSPYFDLSKMSVFEVAKQLAEGPAKNRPDVINYSMGISVLNQLNGVSGVKQLDEVIKSSKTVLVVAAGNDYPGYENQKDELKQSIVVGNMAATGYPSISSSEFKSVFIHAPSTSPSDYGGNALTAVRTDFGGTSGAAPQVSATVANIQQILPEIDVDGIRAILEKTAVATPASLQRPQLNGVGMLNAYGAVLAAKKILAACLGAPVPAGADCFSKQALTGNHYNQAVDASLFDELNVYFPNCSGVVSDRQLPGPPKNASCDELKTVFSKLRRQAFQNPKVGPNWAYLGCVYGNSQFRTEGSFYERLGSMGWPPDEANYKKKLAAESQYSFYVPVQYQRVFPNLDELWRMAKEDPNEIVRIHARSILLARDPVAQTRFRELIDQGQFAKASQQEVYRLGWALINAGGSASDIRNTLSAYKLSKGVLSSVDIEELYSVLAVRYSEAELKAALNLEQDPIKKEALVKALAR